MLLDTNINWQLWSFIHANLLTRCYALQLDEKSAEQAEAATKAADAKKAKEEQAAANKAQMAQTKAAYEAFQAASTSLQVRVNVWPLWT